MYEVFGERDLVIARELTKKFEEILRGTTKSLKDIVDLKGEMVIIVEGKPEVEYNPTISILEEVNLLIEEGMSSKDAIKDVAKKRGIPKNDVYQEYHN